MVFIAHKAITNTGNRSQPAWVMAIIARKQRRQDFHCPQPANTGDDFRRPQTTPTMVVIACKKHGRWLPSPTRLQLTNMCDDFHRLQPMWVMASIACNLHMQWLPSPTTNGSYHSQSTQQMVPIARKPPPVNNQHGWWLPSPATNQALLGAI